MNDILPISSLLALALTYLVHSTVWLLTVGLVLRFAVLEGPFIKNTLWKLAIVGSILTSVIAFHQGEFELPIGPEIRTKGVEVPTERLAAVIENPMDQQDVSPIPESPPSASILGENVPVSTAELEVPKEAASVERFVSFGSNYFGAILLLIWFLGGLVLSLKHILGHVLFFRQIGPRTTINHPTISNIIDAIQRRTQRQFSTRLTTSPYLDGPIVIRGEEICLPEKVLESMNEEQLEAMIAHELAHIVRQDYYWTILLLIIDTFFFFQPLHRLARKEMHASSELLCDAWAARATGNAMALAACLVEVASWIKQPTPNYALVAGMARKPSELSNRITQLLKLPDMKLQKFRLLKIGFPAIGILSFALLVLPGFSFVQASVTPTTLTSTSPEHITVEENETPPELATTATAAEPANTPTKGIEPQTNETALTLNTASTKAATIIDRPAELANESNPATPSMAVPPLNGTELEAVTSTHPIVPSVGTVAVGSCQDLLQAVKDEDVEKVRALLKTVDPDCTYYGDGEARSPLVAAARTGNMAIGKLLLGAKANVEFHSKNDETPLMAASKNGHLAFVEMLIAQGASVDRKLRGDGTALIYAVRGEHYEISKLLLEKGADPYKAVPGDEYAMYHARMSGNRKLIKLLKEYDN